MIRFGIQAAAAAVAMGLTLSACATSHQGEAGVYEKSQSDYQRAIQRNGRPPVGGARAND